MENDARLYMERISAVRNRIDNQFTYPSKISVAQDYSNKYSPLSTVTEENCTRFSMCSSSDSFMNANELLPSNYLQFLKIILHFAVIQIAFGILLVVVYGIKYNNKVVEVDDLSTYSFSLYAISIGHVQKNAVIIAPIIALIITIILFYIGNKAFDKVFLEFKIFQSNYGYNETSRSTIMIQTSKNSTRIQEFERVCEEVVDPVIHRFRNMNRDDPRNQMLSTYNANSDIRLINVAMDIRHISTLIENALTYQKMLTISNNLHINVPTSKQSLLLFSKPTSLLPANQINLKIGEIENKIMADYRYIPTSNYAFVTFPTIAIKNAVYNEIRNSSTSDLQITNAPYLNDIVWNNLSYSPTERKCRTTAIFIISIVFILGILLINIYITYLLETLNVTHDTSSSLMYFLKVQLISIGITLINLICVTIISVLLGFEKNITKSKYNSHSSYYLTAFYTIVVVIVPPASYIWYHYQRKFVTMMIFEDGGILSRIVSNWISLAILPSVIEFFNARFIFYYLRKTLFFKKDDPRDVVPSGYNRYFTQKELNEVYEKPAFDYPTNYSNVMILMFYTCAYNTFFPLGVFITIIGLLLYFWVSKLMIVHAYKSHYGEKDKMLKSAITTCKIVCPCILISFNLLSIFVFASSVTIIVISSILMVATITLIVVSTIRVYLNERYEPRMPERDPLLHREPNINGYTQQNPFTQIREKVETIIHTRETLNMRPSQ